MKLIDATPIIEKYKDYESYTYSEYDWMIECLVEDIIEEIKELPTVDPVHAADAVYCKECKYCKQHHEEQTNKTSYKCTKYSFYDFNDRQPNDFCSKGMLKLPLQEEISAWLTKRTFFANDISPTEFLMQQIYFDNPMYEGKQEDQQEIANNCKTVADAYYYVQTHKLNVNKFYERKI